MVVALELRLHDGKCKFFHDQLAYLGHMINIRMQQAKMNVLQIISTHVNVPRLCGFLGLTNYYCQFVKNFSLIFKPLIILTRNDQPWTWNCK